MLKMIAEFSKRNSSRKNSSRVNNSNPTDSNVGIDKDLALNLTRLKKIFGPSSDIIYYDLGDNTGKKALLVYVNAFVAKDLLNRDILHPLLKSNFSGDIRKSIYVANTLVLRLLSQVVSGVLEGNAALVIEGQEEAYLLDIKNPVHRSIAEPDNEVVVRGPREGFVESLNTNIVLLRKKIKSPDLVVETQKIGKITRTDIALAYIQGIVQPEVLKEVKARLSRIDTDSVLESGYIEQYIQDAEYSPYATVGNTQKPDVVAGKILEGRIAIFCDGTPHALTVPFLYIENLQSSEDYYMRTPIGSFVRILRLLGLFLSTLLPAIYVALTSFHQEMLPNVMLISISGAKEGIPLPAFVEVLMMGVLFELLRESGTRLPRAIGSAISIVGALVIGEAAVNAGLVSAPAVIVTAITAVTSFILPSFYEPMLIFRLMFLVLGGVMGVIGITAGLFMVMVYTVSIRSFGIPYTSSLSSATVNNMKDVYLRFPLWSMKRRPGFLAGKNRKRRG